jgi:sortase (surface protein transpeptidase)
MIELITFIGVVCIIFGAIVQNIRLKNNNVQLMYMLTQTYIDNNEIKNKFKENNDVEKDHLIKFLSESREVSYKYIEDIQNKIKYFVNDLEKEVNFFNQYGVLSQDYPHYETLVKLSKHYEIFKNEMPKDFEDGR